MKVTPQRVYKAEDLSGRQFGRLTAISFDGHRMNGGQIRRFWLCRCDCGTFRSVDSGSLKKGNTKSCGCARADGIRKHGGKGTPEYAIWKTMIQRCTNPKDKAYPRYGGRGIKVCQQWRESFECFLSDMGKRPSPDLTIERKNNEAGYYRENCVWADRTTQALNTRPKSTNKSGVTGVHWDKYKGKWRAQISLFGKRTALGNFDRIEDAKAAYDTALASRKATYDHRGL